MVSSAVRFVGLTTGSKAPCQREARGVTLRPPAAAAQARAPAPPASRASPRMHWIAASGPTAHPNGPPAITPIAATRSGAAHARLTAMKPPAEKPSATTPAASPRPDWLAASNQFQQRYALWYRACAG